MEMSRQRLRAGVIAGSTVTCPHCGGTGLVRSIESTALRVLRGLEEEGEKNRAAAVTVKIANDVAIYILNQKRHELARIETEHGMEISFEPKEGLAGGKFRTGTHQEPRSGRASAQCRGQHRSWLCAFQRARAGLCWRESTRKKNSSTPRAARPNPTSKRARNAPRRRRANAASAANRKAAASAAAAAAAATGTRWRGRPEGQHRPGAGRSGESRRAWKPAMHRRTANGELAVGGAQGQRLPARMASRAASAAAAVAAVAAAIAPNGRKGKVHAHPQAGFSPRADRFGPVPDEIDTTPSKDRHHAPGAPSAPVWSLKDDIPDTTPSDEPKSSEKGLVAENRFIGGEGGGDLSA